MNDPETLQVIAWVVFAVGFFAAARFVAAVLHVDPQRCPLCGSKDTRVVVYKLADDEWTCDKCGHLWSVK